MSVQIGIGVDTSNAEEDLRKLSQHADKVMSEIMRKRRETVSAFNKTLSFVNTSINMFKNVAIAMGYTLDPIQEAALSVIATTITTMQSVATAYATMGPVGWVASAIIGGATIAFSISANMAAVEGMAEASRQLSAAQRVMENISTMIGSLD